MFYDILFFRFYDCAFGNGGIDHFKDLLYELQILTKYVINVANNSNVCAN